MPYIKYYLPEWDSMLQSEVSPETVVAARRHGVPDEGISDQPFPHVPIVPRFKSQWAGEHYAAIEAARMESRRRGP